MINIFAKKGHSDKAFELFEQMEKESIITKEDGQTSVIRKVLPNEITYIALIGSCMRKDNFKKGFLLFNQMKQRGIVPNSKVFTSIIYLCGLARDMDRALQLYDEMKQSRLPIDSAVLNALLIACTNAGQVDTGLQIMKEIKSQHNVSPDEQTVLNLMHSCVKSENVEMGLQLLDQLKPEIPQSIDQIKGIQQVFVDFISVCGKKEDGAMALEVVRRMRQEKLALDGKMTEIFVKLLLRNEKFKETLGIVEQMLIDHSTRNQEGRTPAGKEISDGTTLNRSTINSMLFGFSQHGEIHHALRLLEVLRGYFEPDIVAFTNLVKACGNRRAPDAMEYLFKVLVQMKQTTVKPGKYYTPLLCNTHAPHSLPGLCVQRLSNYQQFFFPSPFL